MLLHGGTTIAVALLGSICLYNASIAVSGPGFLLFLFGTLVAIALFTLLIYRMYALQQARYILARDGISLYWGLRREEIPINKVMWVGSTEQNRMKLTKPFLRFPGAVLGVQTQPDGKPVEFLAGRDSHLIMIVTTERIFAISPANDREFLNTYRRLAEFGSLAPIQSASLYPASLLSRSWADRPARILLVLSAVLALGLIAWVSLAIPSHSTTTLRLNTDGTPTDLVPGIRLLLLPVLNT